MISAGISGAVSVFLFGVGLVLSLVATDLGMAAAAAAISGLSGVFMSIAFLLFLYIISSILIEGCK